MKKQSKIKEVPEIRFFTDENIDVTERIKKEKTLVFTSLIEAKAFANKRRSYFYELFLSTKGSKPVFEGYGVPT